MSNELIFRTFEFDRAEIDDDKRMVPASLSSEMAVPRSFGNEVLEHSREAVDMERAKRGLPLLFSHDTEQPIGRVENIRLDGTTMRGMLRFSRNAKADEVWQDVRDGILTDMSIGYRINDYTETDDGIRATNWLPYEASVVAVPADSNVGINRSIEEPKMTDVTDDKVSEDVTKSGDVIDFEAQHKRALAAGEERGVKAERKRVSGIEESFSRHLDRDGVRELKDACIDGGLSVELANKRLLDFLGGFAEPLGGDVHQTGNRAQVEIGTTDSDKLSRGLAEALEIRSGLADEETKKKVRDNPYVSMSLAEMARECLRQARVDMSGKDKMWIVGRVFEMAGKRDFTETAYNSATTDFTSLLADVANKALLRGWDEAPESWRSFCSVGSVSDFKANSRVGLSHYPTPAVVAENGEFQIAAITDWAESIQASTVGSIFSITRQALVNDDLSGFTRVPRLQGRAANAAVGDAVFELLNTVVTMGEDNAPFLNATHVNGDHGNVQSAGAPSVSTVDAMRVAMGLQTDPTASRALNISPNKLLCGLGYEGTATTLRNAQYDPDATAGTLTPNYVAGTFEVITDARIDGWVNSTNWFMFADPAMYDCIEVAFLNGVEAPYLESRDGFQIDGTQMKVRLDFGAAVLDWRTAQLNGVAPA